MRGNEQEYSSPALRGYYFMTKRLDYICQHQKDQCTQCQSFCVNSLKSRALDFGKRMSYSMGLLMLCDLLKYIQKTEEALFHKVDLAIGTF